MMTYQLRDVGLNCFMLVFRGEDIGAVFTSDDEGEFAWIATLGNHRFNMAAEYPAPFQAMAHSFKTLADLQAWLGIAATPASARA